MTATCWACGEPCTIAQWACWFKRDDGTHSPVDFCCSERCVERWDQAHSTAGHEVRSGEELP